MEIHIPDSKTVYRIHPFGSDHPDPDYAGVWVDVVRLSSQESLRLADKRGFAKRKGAVSLEKGLELVDDTIRACVKAWGGLTQEGEELEMTMENKTLLRDIECVDDEDEVVTLWTLVNKQLENRVREELKN